MQEIKKALGEGKDASLVEGRWVNETGIVTIAFSLKNFFKNLLGLNSLFFKHRLSRVSI